MDAARLTSPAGGRLYPISNLSFSPALTPALTLTLTLLPPPAPALTLTCS